MDVCEDSWAVKKSWDGKAASNGHRPTIENYIDWN